jgi:hypothetical protein
MAFEVVVLADLLLRTLDAVETRPEAAKVASATAVGT